MEGKNTGAVIASIFVIILSAIIGSCFMAFVYAEKKVVVNNPKIYTSESISVANSDGQELETLKLSKSALGIKPVTSEDDSETLIPYSVTSSVGSEGLYASFFVKASVPWRLVVRDVVVSSSGNAEKEREHIMVGLEDVKHSAKNLTEDEVVLYDGNAGQEYRKFNLFVWLHSHSGQDLIGAQISFNLYFQQA
ncbi:MAG: hypothetical protein IJS68_00520 [Clostridia bacterium]|nr:hypothetical protein [Clostridia bacterium]